MKEYLVTGGAGFIGSALAKHLLEKNNHVTIIDNLSTGFRENIPDNADFIKGNCQDQEIYKSLHKKFDAIFHIAGQSSGEISFDDPVYDLQTNTQSTLLLLDYAVKTSCKRFLYASSMSVYGEQPDIPVAEDRRCNPKSFYGIGKIASEHYLRLYQELGVQSTALRLFNVYGPGQNMKNMRQGMVSIFIAMAIQDKHIVVKGSTERFRDFVYIDDVVDAFIECEKSPNTNGNVYNIATGVKTDVRNLLENLVKLFPYDVSIETSGNTPGDQFGIFSSIDLVMDHTDWRPKVSLENGLSKMVKYYLNE